VQKDLGLDRKVKFRNYPDLKPWFDNESDIYDELPMEDILYDE
jgi:hypothetical protein